MPGKIKRGKSGKYFEETADGWVETAPPAAQDVQSSGMALDFAEGVATGAAGLPDLLAQLGWRTPMGRIAREYAPHLAGIESPPQLAGYAEPISDVTAEDPTRSFAFGRGVGGAASSLPIVAATGGLTAPVAATSLISGGVGELASDEVRRRGGGGLAQFAAGTAADFGTGALLRKGGNLIHQGFTYLTPSYRAGQYVGPLELGPETAEDAAAAIRATHASQTAGVDQAYDTYRSIPSQGTAPSDPIIDLAASQRAQTRYSPGDLPDVSKRVLEITPQQVGVGEVEDIRRGATSIAGNRNLSANERRLAGQYYDAVDDVLTNIASQSGTDSDAAWALKQAIAARRELGKAFPESSSLYKLIIDPENLSPEGAQQAFTSLVNSKNREKEVKLALDAVKGNPQALRGLRRAVVLAMFKATEESASNRVASTLDRIDAAGAVLKQVLGDKGFKHFRRLVSKQTTANRSRGFIWRMLAGKGNPAKGMLAGTIVGSAAGGGPGATAGSLAGGAADLLWQNVSPRAAREIAIESLFDGDLYRQITRGLPPGVKPEEWVATMIGSLTRRGIITAEDVRRDQ